MTDSLFVPGVPAPKGSKSYKGHRAGKAVLVESSKAVGPWCDKIAAYARPRWSPVPGAVEIELGFVMPRPKATPKSYTPEATKRPDIDKLARAVLDALTDVAFDDDSQVVELRAYKRLAEIGEVPGVHIGRRIVKPIIRKAVS